MWQMRQNPRVVDVFAHLWSTKPEDMLVSFDAFNYNFKSPIKTSATWFHTDQGSKLLGFHCLQGFVNLIDSGDTDGPFSCFC